MRAATWRASASRSAQGASKSYDSRIWRTMADVSLKRLAVANSSARPSPRGTVVAPNQRSSTSLSTPMVVKVRRVTELKKVSASVRSDRSAILRL